MKTVRLVKKAKKGNKEALLQLIMAEEDTYYQLALTYMGNAHDAMDAMEDMILILYEKIEQLKNEEAFYSWSKTILVNSCKGLLRKRSKLVLVDEWESEHGNHRELGANPHGINSAEAHDPYLNSERQMDIQTLLLQINEQQKEAIQLKYLHDLDYQTIADITQVPVGTVKSRISQGLKKLREYRGGEQNE
ncbi:sigma-70 family RNA polymerase sigma factor [Paenibacillus motobuensis]|uniref:sigma-70 family RNA polymerase sigma factor n=1 Tax=Paenibacillus TaxID=44249 RepID=UPI00203BDAF1|nr:MULTISPECIES: sigma-70 family RNA polymerase sigma factor [Paenibacillus]MCM3042045.1 sigma-70 family RNA polymerase sigma factor [Paenibacillus lutimineralis]MCM3649149.1 sigma-70 family RNA polymerase sigma factor [Paenibacillus motobuensis]